MKSCVESRYFLRRTCHPCFLDHQPIVIFSNDKLPTVKTKYITITNNSDQAKAVFLLSHENKHVLEQLVETNEDPNYNYEILERALTDSYTECFPKRVVKFNKKQTQEKRVVKC